MCRSIAIGLPVLFAIVIDVPVPFAILIDLQVLVFANEIDVAWLRPLFVIVFNISVLFVTLIDLPVLFGTLIDVLVLFAIHCNGCTSTVCH